MKESWDIGAGEDHAPSRGTASGTSQSRKEYSTLEDLTEELKYDWSLDGRVKEGARWEGIYQPCEEFPN